eukprot:COSAG02_NODE_8903_length_2405_cov_1.346054_3_plen_359_part_00
MRWIRLDNSAAFRAGARVLHPAARRGVRGGHPTSTPSLASARRRRRRLHQPAAEMSGTAAMPMPVSLGAAADATRERARHGARTGITEHAWKVILSLQESQRCVLADALLAGVDIAALLSEARVWMATAGRRLEFSFDVDGKAQFFGGTVTAFGKSDGWVDVAFDDGETRCVHLRPALEGTAWRWLPTDCDAGVRCSQSRSRKRKAGRPDEAAAGRGTTQRSERTAASRRRVLLTPPRPAPVRKTSTASATAAKAPKLGHRKTCSGTSRFHGVFWNTTRGGWGISASGLAQVKSESHRKQIKKDLSRIFNDEHEAAKVADDVRRKIRGKDAHGGRSGQVWLRLNFPTHDGVERNLPFD